MRKLLSILISIQAVLPASGQLAGKDTSAKKNTIALLGTYHFNNPNQDQFNVNSDDVLSAKRQKEIAQVTATLAAYKPSHIALEFNANDTAMDARYQRYLKGQHTLNNSELEQIGFRLAKMLGHPHVYPVDAPSIQLDFNPGELAGEYGYLLEQLGKTGDSIMTQINGWLKKYTIGQILAKLNAPAMDKLNVELYYKYLLPIGKSDNQPGPEAVTRWYKRNLLVLHHIMKLAEGKKNQRILVIFGQGHTAMLKQFLSYVSDFRVVNIQQFLPAN
ncbi:MAG TPA: DUF5694 domain-containing protein [Ferruginibacter sp.]|nr:DUF5694 domain-containing protein [Ferruginibacter sp.]